MLVWECVCVCVCVCACVRMCVCACVCWPVTTCFFFLISADSTSSTAKTDCRGFTLLCHLCSHTSAASILIVRKTHKSHQTLIFLDSLNLTHSIIRKENLLTLYFINRRAFWDILQDWNRHTTAFVNLTKYNRTFCTHSSTASRWFYIIYCIIKKWLKQTTV